MKRTEEQRSQTIAGKQDSRQPDLLELEVPLEATDHRPKLEVTSWKQERQEGLKMRKVNLQGKCGCLKKRGLVPGVRGGTELHNNASDGSRSG